MRRVLLTGASGRIGQAVYQHTRGRFQFTLCDLQPLPFAPAQGDEFVVADLTDAAAVPALVAGIDTVAHLAGIPDPDAAFAELLPANILATTHLLDAAVAAGCRRFVFASSAQAVEGYKRDTQIPDRAAPRPANMYGVTKSYGEALCAYHAFAGKISCVALRIGAFEEPGSPGVTTARDLSAWLSPRDGAQLIERAIEAELNGFFIGHGISDNRFKRFDLTETRRVLGYAPRDDAFRTFPLASILGPEAGPDGSA